MWELDHKEGWALKNWCFYTVVLTQEHSPEPQYTGSSKLSQNLWCLITHYGSLHHPIISSSVIPFSSYLQSVPASGSFPMSQFFISGGQSIGASSSASFLPMNIQDWFPLGLTGWISLQSKGLSRVISSTTVHGMSCFGTCWPLGGAWFRCRYEGIWWAPIAWCSLNSRVL